MAKPSTQTPTMNVLEAEEGLANRAFSDITESTASPHHDAPDHEPAAAPMDETPFPFMELPLELRMQIYKIHLAMPGIIHFSCPRLYWTHQNGAEFYSHDFEALSHAPLRLAIFNIWFTSKAIYQESAAIFYRYNHFQFSRLWFLRKFLPRMGPTPRRNITSITLAYTGPAPAQTFRLLKECVGLRHLKIGIVDGSHDLLPRRMFSAFDLMKLHGLNDLLKIRGLEKLEVAIDPKLMRVSVEWLRPINVPAFKDALQILKQPYTAAQLTVQNKKDYPQSATINNRRTTFGLANVKTRAENKMIKAADQ